MTSVRSIFSVLPVGNVLWSLSAKRMVRPTELHVHGLSQDVGTAEMSEKSPGPPD